MLDESDKNVTRHFFVFQIFEATKLYIGNLNTGRILNAPPANPRIDIYRYYNIDPKEGIDESGAKYVFQSTALKYVHYS